MARDDAVVHSQIRDLIVQACLKSGSVTALSLAFDCAEQDSELDPDLRELPGEHHKDALAPRRGRQSPRPRRRGSGDPPSQAPDTGAGIGGRVCPQPITNKIYHCSATWCLPMPDRTKHFEPDDNPVLGSGSPRCGRLPRALWACQVAGGEQDYRLPTADEMNAAGHQACHRGQTVERMAGRSAANCGFRLPHQSTTGRRQAR